MFIEPPHHPWERTKTASMMRSIRSGKNLPPILVHGEQAYSGSHRIDAWLRMDMDIDYVEITDSEYKLIMEHLNMDPVYDSVYDFEPFLDAAIALGFAGEAK